MFILRGAPPWINITSTYCLSYYYSAALQRRRAPIDADYRHRLYIAASTQTEQSRAFPYDAGSAFLYALPLAEASALIGQRRARRFMD